MPCKVQQLGVCCLWPIKTTMASANQNNNGLILRRFQRKHDPNVPRCSFSSEPRKHAKWLPPEAARASSECCRRQTSACQRDLTIDQTMTAQHLRQQHLRHTRFVRGQAGCASGLQAVSRLGSCKAPAPRSATLQDQRQINVNHCYVPPPD